MKSLAILFLAVASFAAAADESTKPDAKSAEADKKKWDVNKPPGEAASVKLDVTSGTWMALDVSPDGKTVVFDLLGDLYVLPIAGGEAKPLTTSIAWDMQPRFSPDGKKIAFLSDAGGGDNVWTMNADGTEVRQVTFEKTRLVNNPVWHPNGQYIAARKHYAGTRSLGSGEIWLYHVANAKDAEGIQLNEKPNWQKDLGEPAFSPDGRYVYYSQDTTPGITFEYNKNSRTQIYQIFRRDLTEGKTRPIAGGPGGAIRPTPSPDGKWLAFIRRVGNQSTLFLKDLSSGAERAVHGAMERDMQEAWAVYGVYPGIAWMPGSKEMVFWAGGKIWRLHVIEQGAKATEIPFRVRHAREVRKALRVPTPVAPDSFDVKQLRWVNVSPQGDKVVYSALGHLYVRALPEGAPKRLTQQITHFEFHPKFSADGNSVVFTTWNDEELGSIRVFDLKSGKETIVSREPGKYLQPALSADGKRVAYVKSRGGYLLSPRHGIETGIYVADVDGKRAPLRVTEEGNAPQFGPDGALHVTRQVSAGETEWSMQLVRIDLPSLKEQAIAKGDFTTDFAISPDAKWLAFRERYHAHVVPFPLAGKTFTVGPETKALPVKRLDVNAGDNLHWSGDSKALHFSLGDELFTRELKDAFAFVEGAPKELPKPSERGRKIGFSQLSDKPSGTIVLSGAKIVTMKGDEIIDNGRIVVQGNRIAAIGKIGDVPMPIGAREIDVKGKTIIPGLVDAHWHGGMGEQGIVPQQSWINFASLAFGVTTLHDPSNETGAIFTQAELQRAGRVLAPRIYSTGTILYGAKGNFSAVTNSLDDALTHLKRMKAAGAISVKSYNQPRRDQRQQILEAARQTGMMVVPEGGSLFQMNMSMIVDGHTGVEHAIPVAHAYEDVRQLWSQTAVGYTPTLSVSYGGLDGEHYWYAMTDVWKHPLLTRFVPRGLLEARAVRRPIAPESDYNILTVAKTATELQRAGVNVNIGAHGQREGLASHWEMWTLAKGGMTPLEAIRAGTLNGAKYLGLDKDVGSLETGKLADLIVIDADVTRDIYKSDRIAQVMLNGRLYEAATLDETGSSKKRKPLFFVEGLDAQTPLDIEAAGETHGHERCGCH
jgi:imidazolonepropionase-like amidohydrolase/Tol biopolymer transport system component